MDAATPGRHHRRWRRGSGSRSRPWQSERGDESRARHRTFATGRSCRGLCRHGMTGALRAHRLVAPKQREAEADASALERKITELVYALYGLAPEEIKIVEDTTK